MQQDNGNEVIWSASPTPMLEDGSVDAVSLGAVVEQHLRLGVTGLFMGGSTGEGPLLTNDAFAFLVRETKRLAGDRLHVAAQVSDTSAPRVKDNMLRMQDAAADSVVIAPPYMPRYCTPGFARKYFLEAIESSPLPVGLYVLELPGANISPDLWVEVAAHPKVSYVKDSSKSGICLRECDRLKARHKSLTVCTGNEFDVVGAVSNGADGALLGTGIFIAGMIRRALEALASGDEAGALKWQYRSNRFLWDLFRKDISIWLGGLKYALWRAGLFRTEFRLMDYTLTDDDRQRIDLALEREGEWILPG